MPCFDCDDGPCYMNCGPARRAAVIRTAYTISHKGGLTYRARAYVEDNGVKHTFIVALGDTEDEATQAAIKYVEDRHRADNVPVPQTVHRAGKIRGALLDAYLF